MLTFCQLVWGRSLGHSLTCQLSHPCHSGFSLDPLGMSISPWSFIFVCLALLSQSKIFFWSSHLIPACWEQPSTELLWASSQSTISLYVQLNIYFCCLFIMALISAIINQLHISPILVYLYIMCINLCCYMLCV